MNLNILKSIMAIVKKAGVDKSIAYSSGARIIQAITGVGSIFFISAFLTDVEQGFFFTFGSIVALQVFFELGFTGIIIQYVAHEVSHLQIENDVRISGEQYYQSRIASLLHFCVKWYLVISLALFITLLLVGFVFFDSYSNEHKNVQWKIPWLLICIGTVIKVFQSPLSSFIQGLGYVKEMNKIFFYQQIALPVSLWVGLMCNCKLYVVGISHIMVALIWNIYIQRTALLTLLKNIWNNEIVERVSYMKEIFPYQWRIALSWISGYFIFQLFNPVLFATEGPVVAGQMGMTLSALNAITAFSMGWINTKIPHMSRLIALREFSLLDKLFKTTVAQLSGICFILLILMFITIWGMRTLEIKIGGEMLGNRFLDYFPLLLMTIPVFLNMFIFSWATYLRCHKKEPFLVNSICSALLCMMSTLILGKLYGLYGITGGYCLINLLLFPWGYWIYKTKKRQWHGNE